MGPEEMAAWRRLKEALREAATDGFAGVADDALGPRLRAATDAILEGPGEAPTTPVLEALRHFRGGLEAFEARGRQDRSRVVAHGLRICMGVEAAAPRVKQRTASRARSSAAPRGLRGDRRASPPAVAAAAGSGSGGEGPGSEAAEVERRAGGGARRKAIRQPGVSTDSLGDPVSTLPGIGPKTAERLAARGVMSVDDLLFVLPAGYQDRRLRHDIAELEEGQTAVLEGIVRDFRQSWWGGRYSARMKLAQRDAAGHTSIIEARWFHPVGGLGSRVETGARVLLAGPVSAYKGALNLVHPEVLAAEGDGEAIAVRYPAIEGVAPRTLARAIAEALARARAVGLEEVIPPEIAAARGLPGRLEALEALHAPGPDLDPARAEALFQLRSPAHRRLVFEELFLLQLGLLRHRAAWRASPTPCAGLELDREELRASLPFEPTGAQWRALDEIARDLGGSEPMLRLLQGDVGSGKTAVAFGAALAVARAGGQTALMAPTGILADQHLRTLEGYCRAAGLRVALLTGATPRARRATTLALLEAGRVDLIVGTHALLVEDVRFARLGLVIVDEQHRFGVEQRTILREKGETPHLLVMTATPIPRSLALTAFGELDVSVIDELPPGREAPATRLFVGRRALGSARTALCALVEAGARAYVVCPLVEASEAVDASDVEATAAALGERLGTERVGVVHGRMADREKEAVMTAFRDGALRVLVATTVIEVGVDVPEATVILVEHAERFGLAQLHQLRGRVGRGTGASHCLIHTAHARGSDVHARLQVLEGSADGFEVAERDLQLRGPGELFGTRQSGAPNVRLSGFAGEGLAIVVDAREAAAELLARDPELRRHPRLRAEIDRRIAERSLYSGDSG